MWKKDARLSLRGQPIQLLAVLLERPGEVVTRAELQQRLWSSGTFVDFDRGLNTSVNRLRDALGDSASAPRYVETVPRRGYRFISPVEILAAPPEPVVEPAPDPVPNSARSTVALRDTIAIGVVVVAGCRECHACHVCRCALHAIAREQLWCFHTY
jgi:DNA-binding winged helix-turn-helix (wHTH) protein